jgi:hypothetical protein
VFDLSGLGVGVFELGGGGQRGDRHYPWLPFGYAVVLAVDLVFQFLFQSLFLADQFPLLCRQQLQGLLMLMELLVVLLEHAEPRDIVNIQVEHLSRRSELGQVDLQLTVLVQALFHAQLLLLLAGVLDLCF